MNKKSTKYTEEDIEVLSDREHVRLRLPVYAGSTSEHEYEIPMFIGNKFSIENVSFIPAIYKCIGEILDNSIDEFAQCNIPNKTISIKAHPILGTYTISDNGRGVPIGKHSTGKYTPEVVFGSLRSGRNFSSDKQSGVIGMNGMGSSITCFCSTEFNVEIIRDGKRYQQQFINGASKITKPTIRKTSITKSGTSIQFQLDDQVFSDITLPEKLMENRAYEIALANPGVTTEYNGKKYKTRKGFDDLIKKLSQNYFKFFDDQMEIYVIFDLHEGIDEKIFSWVNSSLLFEGGICNAQFLNAFYDHTIRYLTIAAKKQKCEVTKNDVRQNLLVISNLKLSDPEYDAQSKTRLTGPNLRKEMGTMIDNMWESFIRKHKHWLMETVLERAIIRHHTNANKKAIKEHQKNLKKRVPGLKDATSKNRFDCQILITEGDSAASMITDARNPKTTAALPLRGKVNNVYGSTVAQLLNMGKVTDMLSAIGLIPGQKMLRSDLRYGKIIIATDADVDGNDIFTLLVNLFYQFWPELFDKGYIPIIYRLVAPNVVAAKGKKRIHFTSRTDFEKVKSKYNGWEITYMKGLGSMIRSDWEKILSGKTDTLIPIIDDGNIKPTLQLLFSNDVAARRDWLT